MPPGLRDALLFFGGAASGGAVIAALVYCWRGLRSMLQSRRGAPVARRAHNPEAVGSIPAAATTRVRVYDGWGEWTQPTRQVTHNIPSHGVPQGGVVAVCAIAPRPYGEVTLIPIESVSDSRGGVWHPVQKGLPYRHYWTCRPMHSLGMTVTVTLQGTWPRGQLHILTEHQCAAPDGARSAS